MRSLKFGTHGVPEFDTRAQSRYRRCMALEYFDWEVGDVFVLHLQGPITLGQATQTLRQLLQDTVAAGKTKILLNMAEVYYIDSSGLGELAGCYATASRLGGQFKILHGQGKVNDMLQVTRLFTVFVTFSDEAEALRSY